MGEERNCNNCGSVHCYKFTPKYKICKNGSLWEPMGISAIFSDAHSLFDTFNSWEFRTTFNKALQAIYLEDRLYVVRSHVNGKYQYTLVEASSEEMAIRKCM